MYYIVYLQKCMFKVSRECFFPKDDRSQFVGTKMDYFKVIVISESLKILLNLIFLKKLLNFLTFSKLQLTCRASYSLIIHGMDK